VCRRTRAYARQTIASPATPTTFRAISSMGGRLRADGTVRDRARWDRRRHRIAPAADEVTTDLVILTGVSVSTP
jgi:hypothetical protein